MNPVVTPEIKEVVEAVHYRPAVSIILPIEVKINLQKELRHSLKVAADKAENELEENYPAAIVSPVMQKLRNLIKTIEFERDKKSIAIYVSPVFQKVLYLDVTVEERILVNGSFEIRDVVYSQKQLNNYLVLIVSNRECRLFMGDGNELVRVNLNIPESVYAYINEAPEKVANFTDMPDRKEIVMDKFLLHIDNALDDVLNTYKLPIFVLGTEKMMGHFKSFSKHAGAVIEYVHGNFEEATMPELKNKLEQYIINWKNLKQDDLMKRLNDADDKKRLAVGMKEVWKHATNKKGQLLVVEKNFMYPAEHGSGEDKIYKAIEPYNKSTYIKDAVDDVIEKVLEYGGDVTFVDEDMLKEYQHIALVLYYP